MKNLHFGIFVIYAIFIVIVTYFHLNWSLAFMVVVFKSKWGIAALMRSTDLVKGMRLVSLLLILYFGCFVGILVWVVSDGLHELSAGLGIDGFL
ncbi:hypothetical protein HanRHA438_Chr08g0332301 [Helianthus annuus]|nr:hypothetical protein HanRHA438_Chr08g0332301 [Helianthus annuus]